MYAVIELQGAQMRVEKDEKIMVNRIKGHKTKTLKVKKVLFGKKGSSYFIGEPYVKDAYVECEITGDKRLKKVIAFKYRERKSSQSKIGHRQDVTELIVKDIHFAESEKGAAEKAKKPEKKEQKTEVKAKKAESKSKT
ncbi:MAG: 50S ribosomal protein L21 [Candidatus Omnitrophota bacterium]|nr:50S ribosomal protein L21 [Candidatus Omnitrophota bacterium]